VNQYGNWWLIFNPIMKLPEGKRPLERPRHGWKNNINVAVQEKEWISVDRVEPAYERDMWWAVAISAMDLVVP
jgi:hypothetical protein